MKEETELKVEDATTKATRQAKRIAQQLGEIAAKRLLPIVNKTRTTTATATETKLVAL